MNDSEFISLGVCNRKRNDDEDPHVTDTTTTEVSCVTRQYTNTEMCPPTVTKQFVSIYYTSFIGPYTMSELHVGFVISGCELCISFRGRTIYRTIILFGPHLEIISTLRISQSYVMADIHSIFMFSPVWGSRPDKSLKMWHCSNIWEL
jgi:hypothetical protein